MRLRNNREEEGKNHEEEMEKMTDVSREPDEESETREPPQKRMNDDVEAEL